MAIISYSLQKLPLIILITFSFLFLTNAAFSEENSKEYKEVEVQPENQDFSGMKKFSLEFGISGLMLQAKGIYLLNSSFNPYIRVGIGAVATVEAQYLSGSGMDGEVGIKYNFHNWGNNRKMFLNSFYIKAFGGATKTTSAVSRIYPFAGTGFGFTSINQNLEFSIGIDLGSTFEYFQASRLSGVIFLRPEINLGFVF